MYHFPFARMVWDICPACFGSGFLLPCHRPHPHPLPRFIIASVTDNKLSVFGLVALLLALSGLSQSLWWVGPHLVGEHGLGSMLLALALGVLLFSGLVFQAERLLVFTYNPYGIYGSAILFAPVRSFWLHLFTFSAMIGGILLVSHHMLVATWQSSVQLSLYFEQGVFRSFPLLLASQQELIGGFGEQLVMLLYVIGGVVLLSLLLAMHLWLVWLLVLAILGVLAAFAVLFATQLPLPSLLEELPRADIVLRDGFVLAFETSLAGFGLVFGLARWRGYAAQPGWLVGMLVLLAGGLILLLLAAWQFARFTWVGETPSSDRLLLHLPFAFSQAGNDWLYWLWFALSSLLGWLKMALILGFGALVIARIARVSIFSTHLMLSALAGFLALCWLTIGYCGQGEGRDFMAGLFELLFEGLLFWWYPLHLLLLCAMALAAPTDDHAAYVWRENYSLAWLLRLSYLPLMLFLLWYLLDMADMFQDLPGIRFGGGA